MVRLSKLLKGGGKVSNALGYGGAGAILNGAGSLAKVFGLKKALNYNYGGGRRRAPMRVKTGNKRAKQIRKAGRIATQAATVTAGAAPTNFARTGNLKPMFKMLPQRDAQNGCMIHCVVQISLSAVTGDGWQCIGSTGIDVSQSQYSWLAEFASLFEKFRLRKFTMHYQHFCPTIVPGEVVLKYTPDPDEPLGTETEAEIKNSSNFVAGGVYEDFSMTADLSGMVKTPLDVSPESFDTNLDDRCAGAWAVYTNHTGAVTDVSYGNLYLEFVIEFFDRHVPPTPAIMLRQVLRNKNISREKKHKLLDLAIDAYNRPVLKSKTVESSVDDLLAKAERSYPASAKLRT